MLSNLLEESQRIQVNKSILKQAYFEGENLCMQSHVMAYMRLLTFRLSFIEEKSSLRKERSSLISFSV